MMPWLAGLTAVVIAGPAMAQGNIDAGKSPAQIFAATCATCHRSPGQVRRASASFLRSHYTTGSEEASAMARYLANVPAEARQKKEAAKPKESRQKEAARPKESPAEAHRSEPKEQARGSEGSSKGGRRAAEAKSAASASASGLIVDSKPPEPAAAAAAAEPPPPALEPFEE
jgi:hypothetical protein